MKTKELIERLQDQEKFIDAIDDVINELAQKDARIAELKDLLQRSHYNLRESEDDFLKLDKEIQEALQKEEA